jgi:hypothetical protein
MGISVTFNCDDKLVSIIDNAALEREVSRSRFINQVLTAWFAPKEPSSYEAKLLENDLRHKDELLTLKEAEISQLREQNGQLWQSFNECNEKLTRFLLPAPKKSFWSRFRRS